MWAPHKSGKKKEAAPQAKRLKALVIYGSSSGTTGRIAESITEGMKKAGAGASAIRVDRLAIMPEHLEGVDIVGVGSPTYFLREPTYMGDCIDGFPDLTGARGFVFCTCGMDRVGETLERLEGRLASRGVRVIGAKWFRTAMSYLPYRRRGIGNPEHLPDDEQVAEAEQFGKEMVGRRNGEAIALEPVSRETRIKARLLANRRVRDLCFPRVRLVRPACTGYGSCLSRCLYNGLDRDEGEKIPFYADSCEQCMECLSWCPRDAIVSDSRLKEWFTILSYHLKLH
jgi:flavodoxin/NAD-dependent dihydropyrimidine dehydrogenase PreA subunit